MKNFRLQPFEKNNYFYGKLLTVRDFQTEQKYNDQKRWMTNRLMFGNGIATGLKVILVDDQTISIEPGVAVDNLGREIVVAAPITQKLSLIDGFDNSGYAKSVYLCLDFEENKREKIQSISNSTDDYNDEMTSFNRIQENYKIYLKESISATDLNKSSSLSLNKACVYEDERVQIFQIMPKYVEPNEEFDILIDVIKKDTTAKIEFSYLIESKNAVSSIEDWKRDIDVYFKEPTDDIKSTYSLKYKMVSQNELDKNAIISVSIKSISINDMVINKSNNIFIGFSIVSDKVNELFKEHNSKSIDSIIDEESLETIYLAKIEMLKVGMTYLIKAITNCPFEQYIYSNNIIIDVLKEKLISAKSLEDKREEEIEKYEPVTEKKSNISSGDYVFVLDYNMKYPKTVFSKEIVHGLGAGEVFINTAVVTEENFEDVLISGDVNIFDKCNCKIATTLYPNKGTFVIAVKVENSFANNQIRIKWQALK